MQKFADNAQHLRYITDIPSTPHKEHDMALPHPLHTLAEGLARVITAHCSLPSGDTYEAAYAASRLAQSQALYLGQNLALPREARAAFLNICGLRAAARDLA